MMTDYKYRIQPSQTREWKFNGKWITVTGIILLQFAIIIYILSPPTVSKSDAVTINKTDHKKTVKEFKFYYLLPKDIEAVVPEHEVMVRSREYYFGKGRNKLYSLQAGSFKSIKQANKLRQTMSSLGLTSQIEIHQKGLTTWHRVVISALSIQEVKAKKALLRKYNIDALVTESTRDKI
jgi:hypothetical protein